MEGTTATGTPEARVHDDLIQVLLETTPEPVAITDRDGCFLRANTAYLHLLGLSAESELVGKTVCDLLTPKATAHYQAEDRQALESGQPVVERQETLVGPSGNIRQVVIRKRCWRGTDGQPAGLVHTWCDVSELSQAEESHLLRTVIDNLPQNIFVRDAAGRYLLDNRAHMRALGVTAPEEVIGKSVADFFPRQVAAGHMADDRRVMRSGKPRVTRENQIVDRQGNLVWHSTTKVPLRDPQGHPIGIICLSHDITERKQAEAALKQQAQELARSNAELEQFAYVASHDLQEPLRMVASFTQLLARRYRGKLDADADEFIRYAVEGTVRMQALIKDLLAYSRVGTRGNAFEPTDLAQVLQHTLTNLKAAIEECAAVITWDPLPMVLADGVQLVQVFQNLIGNALKFRGERPPQIYIGAARKGTEWELRVRDNGIGIEAQYAERIFVIFQRLHTRGEYSGNGMGLAICKKIIERHKGRIRMESMPGEGTTFFFTLPA